LENQGYNRMIISYVLQNKTEYICDCCEKIEVGPDNKLPNGWTVGGKNGPVLWVMFLCADCSAIKDIIE
jgi:hypothetical protein